MFIDAYRPMLSPSFVTLFAYIYLHMKKSSKWRTRAGLQETFAPRANDYLRVSPSPHPCKQNYRFAMTYEYTYDIREATLGNGHTHIVKFIVDNVELNESNRVRDHLFTLPRDGLELYIIPYAKGGSLPPGLTTFRIEHLSFAEVKRQYSRETEETDTERSESERTALSFTLMQASTS